MHAALSQRLNDALQSRFFQRFWSVAGAVSVRTKVLGIVLGTVLLLGTFVTVQVRQSLSAILQAELENQALSITAHVAESAANLIAGGSSTDLDFLLLETQSHYSDERHNTEIAYLFILDDAGRVLGHTFDDAPPAAIQRANELSAGEAQALAWRDTDQGRVLDVAERFALGDGQTGVVRVGLGDREIRTAVGGVTQQLVITSAAIRSRIAAAVFSTWLITRPIRNLVMPRRPSPRDLTSASHPWPTTRSGGWQKRSTR